MRILYFLIYSIWYLVSLLPMRVLYIISDGLYFIITHIVKYRHKVIWKNLRTSFPEKSDEELRTIEKQFYRWFCDYIVETIKMMTMKREEFMRRMVCTGTEKMNEILESGQSVAVYLGHYCNWEYLTSMSFWVTDNCQCCEIYHPLENKAMDLLFKHVRERHNALCIPMKESLRKIIDFNRQGKPVVVGYISDQVPLWWNIHHWVNFLHHDTPVLTGAERIIKHTNEAVFYGEMHRVKRGYYRCDFRFFTADPKNTDKWAVTDWYFQQLEASIREEPAFWLWSHNRWKRTHEKFSRDWIEKNGKVIHRDSTDNQ